MYQTGFLPFCGKKSTSRVSPCFEVTPQKVHVLILFAGKTKFTEFLFSLADYCYKTVLTASSVKAA